MDNINFETTGKLGFGLMRLPRRAGRIDIAHTSKMVDLFLDAGMNYFDTAHIYPGSESASKKFLVDRYPREAYTLATKLYATFSLSANMAKAELDTSLERTGAGYIDYYLLHSMQSNNYKKYEKMGLWDFVREEKEKGRIRHYGFSFHDSPELLDKLLTDHPDAEFVQLQLNYADWENPKVTSRANYEVARKHGKPIVVMEPVKGGALAKPPKEIREIFRAVDPEASMASWAIRFVASLDGILTVLSGMSNTEQMEDNLSYMKDFQPLNEAEWEAIRKAQEIYGHSKLIPCTACRYCTEGCPQHIPIPDIFSIANDRISTGQIEDTRGTYFSTIPAGRRASDCIACGQCEQACPQHLDVIQHLKDTAEMFEK